MATVREVVEQTVSAGILQRELEKQAIQSVVDAQEQAAADSLAIALIEAETIVAASEARFAKLRELREQNLAHDLQIAATRQAALDALETRNRQAFAAIVAGVAALPSVIRSNINQGVGSFGGIDPSILSGFGANLTLNPISGPSFGINQAGQKVFFGPGSIVVEGSIVAEDLASVIQDGLNQLAERGGGDLPILGGGES